MYSPVESDQQSGGKRCLLITEILMTNQALTGVRSKIQNLARDFKDFIDGPMANREQAPGHRAPA